jgi:hypothetical protein
MTEYELDIQLAADLICMGALDLADVSAPIAFQYDVAQGTVNADIDRAFANSP